jgi:O-antigen/teichoic acid export membrane protein
MDTNARADGSPGHLITSFVSLVAGSVVVRILAFVGSVFVTRAVGPSDFGTFAFGLTLAMLFAVCASFGVDDWLVREIARAPEEVDELVGDAALLRLAAVPVGLVGVLGLGLAGYTVWPLAIWLMAFGVLHSYLLLVCAVFRGRGRQRVQALLLSVQMALIATTSIAGTWLARDIVLVAAGYAGASAVSLAIGYAMVLRGRVQPRYQWRPVVWAHLLRTGLPFWLSLLGLLVLDRLAIVSVAVIYDATTLGWFSAVYNLVLALMNVPMAAVAAVFPLLTRTAERSPARLERMVSDLMRYSVVLSLAAAASLHILAPVLVTALFGASYEPSISALRLLTLSVPALFLNVLLINVLEATDRQRSCAIGMLQALGVAGPLCFVATWLRALEGASLAYVVAHLALAASMVDRTARVVGWAGIRRGLLRPMLAGVGLWTIVIVGQTWPPLVLLLLANLGFVVSLISLGAVGPREVHALRAVLPARPGAAYG